MLVASIVFYGLVKAHGQGTKGGRMIDLTHAFDEATIYWPTEDGFKLIRESAGITEQPKPRPDRVRDVIVTNFCREL